MADFMYRCDLTKKLEKMWNSQKFSDTLFLVNNSKFHASSHLVSASSDVLDSLLDTHYQNCDDREITMSGIKNDESFLVILKCIYGMELNFTQMSKTVICEVLHLCETYELAAFSNAIKCFLSTLDCFQLDSVVVLLNTAKKFSLKELYERLIIYAYENADQLVKHKSFAELQFDVLQDLLKSNWFFASEIDILTGALIWHSNNMNQSPSKVIDALHKETDGASVVEDPNDSTDGQAKACAAETNEITDSIDIDVSEGSKIYVSHESAGSSSINVNKHNQESETLLPDETDSCAELVKTFSDNVLKTLLSHIRMKQISIHEYMQAFETELFNRYKVFLTGKSEFKCLYFSENNEPRVKYVREAVAPMLCDITKEFVINRVDVFSLQAFESEEEYLIGGLNWKVCLKNPPFNIHIYLKCISAKQSDWECTTECQFKIIPCKPGYDPLVLPRDGSYKSVTLTSDDSCVKVCLYDYEFLNDNAMWFNLYPSSIHNRYDEYDDGEAAVYTIEVHFKSIQIKENKA